MQPTIHCELSDGSRDSDGRIEFAAHDVMTSAARRTLGIGLIGDIERIGWEVGVRWSTINDKPTYTTGVLSNRRKYSLILLRAQEDIGPSPIRPNQLRKPRHR